MADTRTRIITAANELFRRHGFNGTGMGQISQAAQATTGSIYHFFPGGKEELTAAVIASTSAVYRDLFEAIAAAASDAPSAFADFFEGAAVTLAESDYLDPCPIGTIAREVASTSPTLRLAAEAAFNSWIDAATTFLVGAGIDAEASRRLAMVFVTVVEGGFVLSRTMRSVEPMQAAGATLVPLVEQALERAHQA